MKARSCATALVDVVAELRLKLDENYIAFLVLLDHTQDTVDHKYIIEEATDTFSFFEFSL